MTDKIINEGFCVITLLQADHDLGNYVNGIIVCTSTAGRKPGIIGYISITRYQKFCFNF